MNEVQLSGRLTKNPEIKQYQKMDGSIGLKATYTLAVDRDRRRRPAGNAVPNGMQAPNAAQGQYSQQDQDTDYFRCVAFGKTAGFVQRFLCKGTKVIISGRLRSTSFVGRTGERVFMTEIAVDRHEFGESREENEKRRAAAYATNYGPAQYGAQGGYQQGQYRTGQYGAAPAQYGYQQNTAPAQATRQAQAYPAQAPTQPAQTQPGTNYAPQGNAAQTAPAYQQTAPSYQQAASTQGQPQQQTPQYSQAPQVSYTPSGFMNIPDGIDEELPFN